MSKSNSALEVQVNDVGPEVNFLEEAANKKILNLKKKKHCPCGRDLERINLECSVRYALKKVLFTSSETPYV